MLLGFVGRTCDQTAIVEAAGLQSTIAIQGSRIDQLATAIGKLTDCTLLAKFDSTIQDIALVISEIEIPVGVEWQSTFRRKDGTLYTEGHYSVLRGFDDNRRELIVTDPDPASLFYSGTITFDEFSQRWWEENHLSEPTKDKVLNRGLCFVIVPEARQEPLREMGFQRPTQVLLLEHRQTKP